MTISRLQRSDALDRVDVRGYVVGLGADATTSAAAAYERRQRNSTGAAGVAERHTVADPLARLLGHFER